MSIIRDVIGPLLLGGGFAVLAVKWWLYANKKPLPKDHKDTPVWTNIDVD